MKITLRLNHGATEVHKSLFTSLSVPSSQHPRAWGVGEGKSSIWSLGILRAKISHAAVNKPKGQAVGNPLCEAPGLRRTEGHLKKCRWQKRRVPERDGRGDTFGETSCPLASHGVIKINNRTEPPKQQNANLEQMQKDTERTAKKPSAETIQMCHIQELYSDVPLFFKQLCKRSL